ncbi:MAG: hypothetical protein V2B14_02565 [bacterium]
MKLKIIVISGSYSNIGKTTLAKNIIKNLEPKRIEFIKFGHHPSNPAKKTKLFNDINEGLNYINLDNISKNFDYLIIESNSILKFIEPDLAIFIFQDKKPQKDSAAFAMQKADIIIDQNFNTLSKSKKFKKFVFEKLGDDNIMSALFDQYQFLYEFRKEQ